MKPIRVEVTRGGRVESVHEVSVAAGNGRSTLFERGDVKSPVFMRSCAKPFQTTTAYNLGAIETFKLAPAEIAVMSGSHGGEPEQVAAVQSILRKAGLRPEVLRCGVHPPSSPKAQKALYRARKEPTVLHNNCSGKHSGMVLAAKHLGAPLETYLKPSHPLQKHILKMISRYSEVPVKSIGLGTDGCSAPTFALPLEAMCRAIAHFSSGNGFAQRVREAMMAHPAMVGRPCVNVMSAAPGRLVAKGGAEGVYLCGVAGRHYGLALKVHDGAARVWVPVLHAVLSQFDWLSKGDLESLRKASDPVLKNHAGVEVGEIRVVL